MNKKTIKSKKAHLIGICGKGMSALALILRQKGWTVTGSDEGFYDPIHSMLKKNKIKVMSPYSARNIPEDASLIVTGGKFTNFSAERNEEIRITLAKGKKIKSVPEVLAELSSKTENTIIAGSFGKSTTTALLSWCLINSKKDPSYFIGAVPIGFKKNAHIGKSGHFIMEGDEYPSSNWDNISKFLHMRPKNLILISAEHDHMNVFPTEKSYLKPYQKLISILPKNGLIMANSEGKNVGNIAKKAKCKVVNYSLHNKSSWHAENIIYGEKTSFDLFKGKDKIINLETILLGNHNIENIIGISAFLLEKKLITKEELKRAVKTFKGLSGRLDLKTKKSSVLVYEGFGSSYVKAKSVFDALKLHFPNKKIISVFEPHSSSWSNTLAKKWYKNIFNGVNKIIMLPPPAHRAKNPNQMTFQEIIKEVKKHNKKIYKTESEKEVLVLLKNKARKNDIIVLISSGSLYGLTASVPRLMEKMFPKKLS